MSDRGLVHSMTASRLRRKLEASRKVAQLSRVFFSCAVAVAVASCGEDLAHLPLDMEVLLFALEGNEALQVVVLANRDRNGRPVACEDVVEQCVADQPLLRVRQLDTPSGTACAARFHLDLDAAVSTDGQPLVITGIPPGSGYLLVVEVVRPTGRQGEERLGAGCIPLQEITKGTNPPPPSPLQVRSASACRPSMDAC